MFEFIRDHQLNIMLVLCGSCGILAFLLLLTKFLSKKRKWILIFMELTAFFLLWFDRLAYIYAGTGGTMAFIMVRVSNCAVFVLTSGIVFGFNMYVTDWLTNEGKIEKVPTRLAVTGLISVMGMILAVISAFTNLYYYFDETNLYHRGRGFLIAYVIPIICPIIQYTVIRQYRKVFGRLIYISMVLYIYVPLICGILQIFTYGISIVNMSMVAVSVSMYFLMYLDLNNTVERAHEMVIENMQGEHQKMRRLFDQTATAFVSAVEKKDDFSKGNAIRVADYAKKISRLAGYKEEETTKIYYTALLHDVGMIGIPDDVIKNDSHDENGDSEEMRKMPEIGQEILSSITEYPFLSQGAYYSHERYDGTGYPKGLKGNEIPESARIIGVADDYVSMTSKKHYRDEMPDFAAREAIMKGAGAEYDPAFADIMVKIIDAESRAEGEENAAIVEKEIYCGNYRERVTAGIKIGRDIKRISFNCRLSYDEWHRFSEPSIVVFDSYDGMTHDNDTAIEGYNYREFGEVWFDKYSITTLARKIKEETVSEAEDAEKRDGEFGYEIIAGGYDDHLRFVMRSPDHTKEVIMALPGGSKSAYIGITGENCSIYDITIEPTGETLNAGDIPRIAKQISYIDHLESDLKNLQIDGRRSAATEGIEIKGRKTVEFHTMSLPDASLVWHCPYIVIYSSENGQVNGEDYREYALIKLNGENEENEELAENRFKMKRKETFTGWDDWKNANRKGMDCEVSLQRKGSQIIVKTENMGISIENSTTPHSEQSKIYAALTGERVALTDIRIT